MYYICRIITKIIKCVVYVTFGLDRRIFFNQTRTRPRLWRLENIFQSGTEKKKRVRRIILSYMKHCANIKCESTFCDII